MSNLSRALMSILLLLAVACGRRSASHQPADSSLPPGTVLTADDIRRSPGQSLEQLLLARVPGLTLTRAPDGHPVLHLRGTTTILGDDEPLFVVNGIPLGPNASGNLAAIALQDIETVQVFRDGATTAAYGIRGANGVILIRTKQS